MKNYAAIALVACVALVTLASTPSHAQTLIKADVPFSFCAGSGMLPAGEYSIGRIGIGSVLLLSSRTRGVEVMLAKTTEERAGFDISKLVFHRYGDEYFLAEIWSSNDNSVRTLPVQRRERQLAKAGANPQVAVVYGNSVPASGN